MNESDEPRVPRHACKDTGKIDDRRCLVCHGEPLTYSAFENLSNYIRTINLNVPRKRLHLFTALHYLRLSEKTGQPGHPLYLPYSLKPTAWNLTGVTRS